MNLKRKGQEEIVGFVGIVVLVSVVLLVFLAIMVRQKSPQEQRNTAEVENFLEAAGEYSSDCAPRFEPAYSSLGGLMKECRSGTVCTNGRQACDIAKDSWKKLIESSWQVGDSWPVKGYVLNISYQTNSSSGMANEQILLIKNGSCSGSLRGAENLAPDYPGTIVIRLSLCS